jgi:thioredoxin-dependent peroxiredoxin
MRTLTLLALTAGFTTVDSASAADLKVGDPAPKFNCKDDAGKDFKSSEVVGKKVVVVYFYPADFTGGCTKQACGFRDNFKPFADKGIEVLGISGDSVDGHKLFKAYHKLPFTLLADEDGAVAAKFGVPLLSKKGGSSQAIDADGKKVEIKQGVRTQRWTFVIDKDGKVAYVDKKVNAPEDYKKVMDAIEKLSK